MKNNILKFGKYKGVDIQLVEERDPQYILWLVENVKMFKNYYSTKKKKEIIEEINFRKNLIKTEIC